MGASILTQDKMDKKKMEEGVWVKPFVYEEGLRDFEVLVRSLDSMSFKEAAWTALHPHWPKYGDHIPPSILDPIEADLLVDNIFLDFRGAAAIDLDGNKLENTRENRLAIAKIENSSICMSFYLWSVAKDPLCFEQDESDE